MSKTVFSLSLLIEVFERDPVIFIKEVKNRHGRTARRAGNRVITEGRDDGSSPGSKAGKGLVLLFRDGSADAGVGLAMASIDTVIADHFKVFFRDVAHEPFDEVHGRNGLMNKDIIFVSVVVEGNGVSNLIIGVDAGRGNHGTAEITTNIVEDSRRTAFIAFGMNVEPIFGVTVNGGF